MMVDWNMVGGLAGIAALVVSIVVAISQRRKRVVEYRINTRAIIASDSNTKSRIKILFDDNPVDNVYFSTVTVRNVGNVAIRPEDWVQEISLLLEQEGKFLQVDAGPMGEYPFALPTIHGNHTHYHKVLLNKGEQLVFAIIHSGLTGVLSVRARIADAQFRERSGDWRDTVIEPSGLTTKALLPLFGINVTTKSD